MNAARSARAAAEIPGPPDTASAGSGRPPALSILGPKPCRIYILPTRHGYAFVLALCAMLLGAINYSNGLAYALTFLLASLALVSMLHANRNLAGLKFGVSAQNRLSQEAPLVFILLWTTAVSRRATR